MRPPRALLCAALLFAAPTARGDEAGDVSAERARLAAVVLDRLMEANERVLRVAGPIRIAGAPDCGNEIGAVLGMLSADRTTFRAIGARDQPFDEALVGAAVARFQLDQRPRVLVVAPGLPAESAGLRCGDVILSVAGKPATRRSVLESPRPEAGASSLPLRIERDGETLDLAAPVRIGCAYPARGWFGNEIGLAPLRFGSQTGVYVTLGTIDFVESDDELAFAIALGVAALAREPLPTKESEAELDRRALYLVARAGFDVAAVPALFARVAREFPGESAIRGEAVLNAVERELVARAVAAEIAAKQSTGRALDTPGEPLAPARADDLEQERRRAGLAELQRERERLLRVHQRLRTGARAHCADEQGPVLGALLGRRAGVGYDNRSEAVFESTQELRVLAVLEGGAADEAGLRAGDVVRRVNGAEVERTQDAFAALRAQPERAPTLQIARADEILEVSLPLVTGCRHDLILTTDEAFDTRADDDRDTLLVPHGLLRFAASDDELAFALAHQLAHHLLDTTQNSRIADEPPADRLAVQLVRNAGFDAGVATALLDRMVAMDPGKLGYDTPGNYMGSGTWHGGAAERALAIRAELELLADGR